MHPWRHYKDLDNGWGRNHYMKLLKNIQDTTNHVLALDGVNSKTVNIMMLGCVQSGKSSTIDSFYSILKQRIIKMARSGYSSFSFTQKNISYATYELEDELEQIVLFDIMENEVVVNEDVLVDDIKSSIKGGIKYYFQEEVNLNSTYEEDILRNEIHCVMYCVDAEMLEGDITPYFKRKMQAIESELKAVGQDRIVLVTKIDTVCPDTENDIKRIFCSYKVEMIVRKAAIVFRVPINQVFPIKNYTNESATDKYKNIPLLLALTKAVDFGTDYIRQMRRARLYSEEQVFDNQESEA